MCLYQEEQASFYTYFDVSLECWILRDFVLVVLEAGAPWNCLLVGFALEWCDVAVVRLVE